MIANINLLPQREKKTNSSAVIAVLCTVVLLVGSMWMYTAAKEAENEKIALENQLMVLKTKTEQLPKAEETTAISGKALEQMVKTVQEQQVKTVPLLKKITSFLPARGVVQTLSYQEQSKLVLEIRFDEKRDAAYFYNRLMGEAWAQETVLSFLKAVEVRDQQGNVQGIPRYLAHYEIKLNASEIKQLEKEENQ